MTVIIIGWITIFFLGALLIGVVLLLAAFGIGLMLEKLKDYKEQKKIWNGGWNRLTGKRWEWHGTYYNYVRYKDSHDNTCVISFRSIDKYKYLK